ncbi:ABC transporter permease [Candidatus Cardinium hertigii]|uniref:ABC transporter permease n=2 Tax=Candidatus Cardinium hertigii TaxID=247481 RepID=A0A3N2QB90_9BACT|nr:ABC transporter permease [Candidatus Cardinium hertigii]
MFEYQSLVEVYNSLREHKVRTFFTGFGVMWAMIILVLLQGGGRGFYKGTMQKFHNYGNDIIYIQPGYTAAGRLPLTEALADHMVHHLNVFEEAMPIFEHYHSISYAQEKQDSPILGVRVGYEKVNNLALAVGRFFTKRDLAQKLPVCILGSKIKNQLFGTHAAIGKFISIGSSMVCIIGVLEVVDYENDKAVIIPNTFFKVLFPTSIDTIHRMNCILKPKQNAKDIEKKIRTYLAKRLHFKWEDRYALYIFPPDRRVKFFQTLFVVIQGFIWLISLCFLLSGLFNVGNMMLVVVQERTQEIAIRKVLGAGSKDIIGLILLESIIINLMAGIIGISIGIGLIQWINRYLLPIIAKHAGCTDFEYSYTIALVSLAILVCSGCLAGLIPAKRALYIKPIDALNNE